ncbi:MAG: glycosyltransferase family 4 protein [Coleofasciculaceae cyanobacterium]
MRLLIYSYNYAPEPIGIAPLVTELAEGLVKKGHEVRVVTAMPWYPQREIYEEYKGKLYQEEIINGVTVQRSHIWVSPQAGLIDRILMELSFVLTSFLHALVGKRPDVILLTVPGLPVSVPAALLAWLYRSPLVLNLQDILPDAAVITGLLTNKKLIDIFKALEKFAYWRANKISVIANGFVDNLLSKGVSKEKIELIPNWVDVNFIRPMPKENNAFCLEHQLGEKFVVMYAGNIALTQGIETVINAAVRLRNHPDIEIVIVGDEKALTRLQLYRDTCKATNVKLLPFQPREKLPEMLAAADVGLVVQKRNVISFNMPSKIPVLLASGRAIIGSVPATGTAARAIEESGGGIVVPPETPAALARAIWDLYKNRDQVKLLGEKSRKFAIEKYSFEQALEQYEQLFASVEKH